MGVERRCRGAAGLANDAGNSSEAAASFPKPRLLILLLLDMSGTSRLNNEKRPVGQGDGLPGRRAVGDADDQKNL
jgi:hypothetical protein